MKGTPRLVACLPSSDYSIELRFADGLAGRVHVGNLVDLGAFNAWRDMRLFLTGRVDDATGCAYWPAGGVRLDPEILYLDLVARGFTAARPSDDPAFRRFMARMGVGGR